MPPAVEGIATLAASVALGVPVGLGMAMISVRVLNPLFTLPPPLIRVDALALTGLIVGVIAAASLALVASVFGVARLRTVSVLRET